MARVALVTGGTRGIGAEISRALQAQGRTVVANYAGNQEAASAFTKETGIRAFRFDVCDFEACKEAVGQIASEIGPIEIVVNNAGITRDGTLARMTREMWDAVIDTNLGSCYNLCKLTFDAMRERKFGRIVNVGSINGQAGPVRSGQLRRGEVGHPRFHQGFGAGRGALQHHGQRHRPRLCRY